MRKVTRTLHRTLSAILVAISSAAASDTSELISWLLEDGRDLRGIPFSEVVESTTGRKILPVDPAKDQAWIEALSSALDRTLARLNAPSHPIHDASRINEASRFIEDHLCEELNLLPGWTCDIPVTDAGSGQRSGYPDLRVVLPDGTFVYLDPKLFDAGSRTSSLRTFYFEPKTTTNKIHHDARHVLIGVSHNGKSGGDLRLLSWELVDLSRLRVQLKAEFQASNADIYRDSGVIGRSMTPP